MVKLIKKTRNMITNYFPIRTKIKDINVANFKYIITPFGAEENRICLQISSDDAKMVDKATKDAFKIVPGFKRRGLKQMLSLPYIRSWTDDAVVVRDDSGEGVLSDIKKDTIIQIVDGKLELKIYKDQYMPVLSIKEINIIPPDRFPFHLNTSYTERITKSKKTVMKKIKKAPRVAKKVPSVTRVSKRVKRNNKFCKLCNKSVAKGKYHDGCKRIAMIPDEELHKVVLNDGLYDKYGQDLKHTKIKNRRAIVWGWLKIRSLIPDNQ